LNCCPDIGNENFQILIVADGAILNKTDRGNISEFMNYTLATNQLAHLSHIGWWVSAMIRENVLRIVAMLGHVTLAVVGQAASQMVRLERLHHDLEHNDLSDPWESETMLKEQFNELQQLLLGRKADIRVIYDSLDSTIRMHREISAAMKIIAEKMQTPEIASIPHDPMGYVEKLNESLRELEDPYRDVFPEIDLDSLEPGQEEIDDWVTRVYDIIIPGIA